MRLLVTGGAGFIGSNFVHRALARGDEVTVYDALTYAGNPANLAGLDAGAGYRFVHGDVCDGGALADAMTGHDAVVHFAAESHVDRSITDPARFVITNCEGTATVCEVALRLGVEPGGCSGLSYAMGFDTKKTDTDRIFEFDGVQTLVY